MVISLRWIAGVASLVCMAVLVGCGSGGTKPGGKSAGGSGPREPGQVVDPGPVMAHEDEDHSHGEKLSAEDQALADAQKVCPVSDEELGGMGLPVKLIVKGEPIFICCKGCEKKINADPDKYLAKVAGHKKAKPE